MDTHTVDSLGDRLKSYELRETGRSLLPGVPVYARLDGRGFSKFTADMHRPFDARMHAAMVHVLKYLVDKSGATVGYTCSDELSLCWPNTDHNAEMWFVGKLQKLTSVLAGAATVAFVNGVRLHFDNWLDLLDRNPHFDCRVFQVPNLDELSNCMLWRNLDCTKNSVSMAAHAYHSHAELQGVSHAQQQEMLFEKGVNFNDYPASFKRGTFVRKQTVSRSFDPAAWASIPIQHRPHIHTELMRSELYSFDLPPLNRIANPVQTLFEAATPEAHSQP